MKLAAAASGLRESACPARSLRIAFLGEVSKRPTPSFGGTGINLIRLGNALAEQGHEIHLVMACRAHLEHYGERLHPAIKRMAIGRGRHAFQIAALLAYVVRHRPDIVVAQDSRAMDLAVMMRRMLPSPPRVVCVIHNESVVRREQDPGKERRKYNRFARIAHFADGLVGVSPGLIRMAQERVSFSEMPVRVIPSPACSIAQTQDARQRPVPRPYPAGPHVIAVARLSVEKDQATLVRAFAQVRRCGVDASLTLLGEGPERPGLAALIREAGVEEHVHMPGFVDNPLAYMADADVLVVSSIQEAFGLVIVEALAMGLPVVSTDCPYGPRYILDNGRYGHLVPIGDSEAMSAAIIDALRHRPDPGQLMARARDFDVAAIAAQYLSLFDSLLASPAGTCRGD